MPHTNQIRHWIRTTTYNSAEMRLHFNEKNISLDSILCSSYDDYKDIQAKWNDGSLTREELAVLLDT